MEVEGWALVAQVGSREEVRHRRVKEVSEARRVKCAVDVKETEA